MLELSGISHLASISFALSLAYLKLERSRHRQRISELERDELTRLGEPNGYLKGFERRKYYKILQDLAKGNIAKHKSKFRVSANFISQLFIELHFKSNLDRKISNGIMMISFVSIVIANLPLTYFIPSAVLDSKWYLMPLPSVLLLSILFSTLLILNGEHIVASVQETIETCGSD